MNYTWIIAAVALPFIAGLHRYACSYGYRGATRGQAFCEAWQVALVISIVVSCFAAWSIAMGQPWGTDVSKLREAFCAT